MSAFDHVVWWIGAVTIGVSAFAAMALAGTRLIDWYLDHFRLKKQFLKWCWARYREQNR